MLRQNFERLLGKLEAIDRSLRKRPSRHAGAIERRIGRWLGRYTGAETMVEVTVIRDARGRATGLEIRRKEQRLEWALMAHGAYLLRTNCPQSDPCAFWQWYIQLQQAEAAFRTGKSDLWLRPVFHQKTESAPAVPTSTGKKADQSAPRSRPNALQANPVQRQTSQLEYDGVVCGTLSSSVCPAEHSRSPSATRRTISLIASDRLRLTPCSPIFPISTQTPLRVATLR
jgi:hypothetical protein